MAAAARAFAGWYNQMLLDHPIVTKSITSGLLFGIGDAIAQSVMAGGVPETYDWERTKRMVIWGVAGFAPLAHGWYKVVDKLVTTPGIRGVLLKVVYDQLLWTPPINMVFFTAMGLLEGKQPEAAFEGAKNVLWPTLKVNWVVWPLIQAVTFGMIPQHQRVLFINCCSLGWSTFLSYMANNKQHEMSQS